MKKQLSKQNCDGTLILRSAAQLAKKLGTSAKQVDLLDGKGDLPAPIPLGASKKWLAAEISAWAASGCPDREQWEYLKRAAE